MPGRTKTFTRERTPFIGRMKERALLLRALEGSMGLLTITGPSGVGKTRLLRQLLSQISAPPGGGLAFSYLGACRSRVEIEAEVARSLGIPGLEGDALAEAIDGRGRLLLALDDASSAAAEMGDLAEGWLDRCGGLQVIATSLLPLGVEGEIRFELGPLELTDAVSLYKERAHRAWAGRTFTDGESADVEELVQRLDRIPKTIELAAARVRVLPPRTLLSRFDEHFELLSLDRDESGALLDPLAPSWALLSEEARSILMRASVFEGSFRYEAAIAILGDMGSEVEILDLLDGLRSKGLLQIEERGLPRFRLLAGVRVFAAAKAAEASAHVAEATLRHAAWFVEEGEAKAEMLEGSDALDARRWIEAERDELLAIVDREAIGPSWNARAALILLSLDEGELAATRALPERALGAARQSADPLLISNALCRRSVALARLGRIDEAAADCEEALSLCAATGDLVGEGKASCALACCLSRSGEFERAASLLERAIVIGRKERLPLLEGSAHLQRGAAWSARRKYPEAIEALERGIALLRHHGHLQREGAGLIQLAAALTAQGQFRESRRAGNEAVVRSRQIGSRALEAEALLGLATTELAAGILEDASTRALAALSLYQELGELRGGALALGILGCVALEEADPVGAEARLVQAVADLEEEGDSEALATLLPFLAVMEAKAGRLVEARRTLVLPAPDADEVSDQPMQQLASILSSVLDLVEVTAKKVPPAEAARLVGEIEERLAAATPSAETAQAAAAIRLLRLELERFAADAGTKPAVRCGEMLRIGTDASWFEAQPGQRVDLRRRLALRQLLATLVEERLERPGVALNPDRLFEVGWPGVKLDPEPARRRVYIAIWNLRGLGLADALLHRTDGYLLDPQLPVVLDQSSTLAKSTSGSSR